jgi:sugar lactone lactonase YvrE
MKRILFFALLTLSVFGFTKTNAQIEIIQTIGGTGSAGYSADNVPATTSKINNQYLMAMDAAGNLYIADNGNARIRMITAATGIITTVAGGGSSGLGDGGPATAAQLGAAGGPNPGVVGVAVDPGANFLYISDGTNNRIRVVTLSTGIINTICGNGTAGFAGDGGFALAPTCQISQPRGIAVDGAGNIYFVDNGNQRLRMITAATGIITTIAGIGGAGGYVADGVAANTTKINNVRGLTVDAAGNVFIADMTNNRIRRIDAVTNIITTVAGNGTGGYVADGVPATSTRINLPTDVKFDAAGNMYIADVSNNRVRMVTPAGIISTVAGAGGMGSFGGDGGLATAAAARLSSPVSIAVDPSGRSFYISDRGNNRIRQVRPNSIPYFTGATTQTLTVCESSAPTPLNTMLTIIDSDQLQTITWSNFLAPVHGTLVTTGTSVSNGGVLVPTGKTYQPTAGYSGQDSFYVMVSDGFNFSIDTIIVTVNPLPVVAAISGSSTVCQTATITLTDATGSGTWSESTGNASVAGGVVTGITPGTDVISYSVSNSCGSTVVTQAITINPMPDAGTITGPSSVCIGSPITLTDVAAGGSWGATNGNASVSGGIVTGITAGTTDDISYTVINSCGTVSATVTVTIMDIPGIGTSLSGPSSVCQGLNITLTSVAGGGAWSESTGNASVSGGVVTGVTAGTDNITYSLINACGSNNLTKTITVNPLPNAGAITGLTSVCIAGNITLTDAAPGGIWSASNANATVSSTGVVHGTTAGSDVISYSVTNFCGTVAATVNVNVVSTPSAGIISGPGIVCQGAPITLTDGVPGGVWTASNANATVSGGVVTGVTAGTDIIKYTVTFSCGTAFTTKTVTINLLPVPAAISGSLGVCLGGTTTLTDPSISGLWSATNTNASITGSGVVTGLAVGLDTILYSLTNTCGTVSVSLPMVVNPVLTPGVSFTAFPSFTTCPGTLVSYSALPVNGGVSPVYQWKVNGIVLASGATFNYTPVNGDVIITKMTSSLACISAPSVSDTAIATVNVSLLPVVHIAVGITGDTVCIGDNATFTATPVNGGPTPSYQWNVNGSVYSFSNPFVYSPVNGDVVTCDLTSSYVCPLPATVTSNTITMTVNTTETPTVSITVSPGNPICAGELVTYTAHSLYGGVPPSFRWTKNGVNVATGPNYIVLPSNGDMVYAMLASSATCRTADSVFSNNITMTTVHPAAISVNISALSGISIGIGQRDTLIAIVTGAVGMPTYQWFVNGTAVAGATTSVFIVTGGLTGTEEVNCVAGSGDVCATSAISNHLSLTISNVGVGQIAGSKSFMQLIPNPSKGVFTISLESANDEIVQVIITNLLGEKVMAFGTTTNKVTEVRLNQPAGIYLLTATGANGRNVAKIVVE